MLTRYGHQPVRHFRPQRAAHFRPSTGAPPGQHLIATPPGEQRPAVCHFQQRDVKMRIHRIPDSVPSEHSSCDGTDQVEIIVRGEYVPVDNFQISHDRVLPGRLLSPGCSDEPPGHRYRTRKSLFSGQFRCNRQHERRIHAPGKLTRHGGLATAGSIAACSAAKGLGIGSGDTDGPRASATPSTTFDAISSIDGSRVSGSIILVVSDRCIGLRLHRGAV